MKIEKRYHDNETGAPDEVYESIFKVREFYESREESREWIANFLELLVERGEWSDKFATYKIVYESKKLHDQFLEDYESGFGQAMATKYHGLDRDKKIEFVNDLESSDIPESGQLSMALTILELNA